MNCYTCEQPAINACKRCARAYCGEHVGATYCAGCLHPASALPSFNLYRGALLLMLVGTALAVFLILRPPGESTGAQPVIVGRATPTPTSVGAQQPTIAVQTPAATGTPAATRSPSGESTEETTGTPRAGTTGTPSPFNQHIVVAGDTLFDIAVANLPPGDDVVKFAKAIAALNGLDYDNPSLSIGQKLLLPRGP